MERPKYKDFFKPEISMAPRRVNKTYSRLHKLGKYVDELERYINYLESKRKGDSIGLSSDVSYRFHPQTGYDEAKKWLQEIGEWEYVSTHGFSTDGWSIVATANAMWNKRNGS